MRSAVRLRWTGSALQRATEDVLAQARTSLLSQALRNIVYRRRARQASAQRVLRHRTRGSGQAWLHLRGRLLKIPSIAAPKAHRAPAMAAVKAASKARKLADKVVPGSRLDCYWTDGVPRESRRRALSL